MYCISLYIKHTLQQTILRWKQSSWVIAKIERCTQHTHTKSTNINKRHCKHTLQVRRKIYKNTGTIRRTPLKMSSNTACQVRTMVTMNTWYGRFLQVQEHEWTHAPRQWTNKDVWRGCDLYSACLDIFKLTALCRPLVLPTCVQCAKNMHQTTYEWS